MAIIHVDEKTFSNEIIGENVLIDFYADWCGPCKMLEPILKSITEERSNVKIIKVNVDSAPKIAASYNIMSIPTLIHLKNNRIISKKIGLCSKDDILEMINE